MDPVLTSEQRHQLIDALGESQRIGMLGAESVGDVVERSFGFVRSLPHGTRTVIDLGSGGGDPGLVIAMARAELTVTLVDRRAKRTDVLTRLVGRLGLADRVEVLTMDVARLPHEFPGRLWDVVTSRGFGSPEYTAVHAAALLAPGGHLLVSEPPASTGDRWRSVEVARAGLTLEGVHLGVASLVRSTAT